MAGGTGRYEKRLGDLAAGDVVVYDVGEFRRSADSGDLVFGVTRMSPGRVGDEFFLTRGHIHARPDRAEIYYGQRGRGLMQLESPEGETRIIEMAPQALAYVPPFWIHRSINVGDEDFVTLFCYPADAGQDYAVIERAGGMRHRVVAAPGSGWTLVENAGYRPRTPDAVRALIRSAA
jgi:glucose-6-phosphate isomerase